MERVCACADTVISIHSRRVRLPWDHSTWLGLDHSRIAWVTSGQMSSWLTTWALGLADIKLYFPRLCGSQQSRILPRVLLRYCALSSQLGGLERHYVLAEAGETQRPNFAPNSMLTVPHCTSL